MKIRVTTDLKALAYSSRSLLNSYLAGNTTEEGDNQIGPVLDFIFKTRNPFDINLMLEFVGELYALERGEYDDDDEA